jgi:uncharacterized protein YciI
MPRYHDDSAWDKEASDSVRRHFLRLQADAKAGKVVLAGRTREPNESTLGLVIFRADTLEDAQQYLAEDPAVVAGVMQFEVRPYAIAVLGEG